MKVAILGTGYVGLVTGTCLAAMGNTVYCCDIDEKKVNLLNNGQVPFYEPGLETLIQNGMEKKHLHFTTDTPSAVAKSEVVFIAVGTPPKDDGSADLQYVKEAAKDIAKGIKGFTIVADKSTVPIGTADMVRDIISGETDEEFTVISVPEFLKEGDAVNDFMKPDRVVVGYDGDPRVEDTMNELFRPFLRTGKPVLFMDIRSAEMTKYASNCMLATKISFINEMANICEQVGADINNVRRGMGTDRRIGFEFLHPGLGYGGSCFPKDVEALIHRAKEAGYEPKILQSVNTLNTYQRKRFFEKILGYYNNDIKGKTFAMWGLSFKPRTDDIRMAPAISIIDQILEHGGKIQGYDPQAMENIKEYYGDKIELFEQSYQTLENADSLIISTEWNEFRTPDFEKIKEQLAEPVIFDGRNLYTHKDMKRRGFTYFSIGYTE